MGFSIMRPLSSGAACAKITNGSTKEISIAADDSAGALPHYSRSDIRLFLNNKDVTWTIWPDYGTVYANVENLERALAWLKEV